MLVVVSLAVGDRLATGQVLSYCNTSISHGTWCGRNDIRHTYHGQEGSVSASAMVCERMLYDSTGAVRFPGPTCGTTIHRKCYTGRGQTSSYFQAEVAQYSGGSNGLAGSAYYGTLSPNIC